MGEGEIQPLGKSLIRNKTNKHLKKGTKNINSDGKVICNWRSQKVCWQIKKKIINVQKDRSARKLYNKIMVQT